MWGQETENQEVYVQHGDNIRNLGFILAVVFYF